MFGFPRLMSLLKEYKDDTTLIDFLLGELAAFTGPDWEQEDDVTIVTLQRLGGYGVSSVASVFATRLDQTVEKTDQEDKGGGDMDDKTNWKILREWTLPSKPGN